MASLRSVRVLGALVAAVVTLGACGGGDEQIADLASRAEQPATNPLPAITVDDVTNDTTVALDSLLPARQPVLIWFWAPH